ncbi:MAG TPA: glycoside hydrolase family 28 protein [Chryseosolibacter sp.]|nr:glycoside hydrolase family 28 protein [Chryseosolibacter sp.]
MNPRKIAVFCFLALVTHGLSFAQYNVKEFGARGDGKTLDTKAIQTAIDAAHKQNGGVVDVPAGTYLIGTLVLKGNVNLTLRPGAVLLGSPNYSDYSAIDQKFESRTRNLYAKYFMIFAEDAKNISITGSGIIDGNGRDHFRETYPQNLRPFMIRLVNCENVTIRDVHLLESANWTLHLLGCRDVNIDGVAIENSGEGNRDGLDIDASERVTVSNSRFLTTDDAIVLKTSTDVDCRDIAVTNCILRTKASAIKIGTESNGGFRNITVSNCAIRDVPVHAGIELMTVDGGVMQNILIENISMENVATPLFIKLGVRARPYKKGQYVKGVGDVRDIFLNNITVTNAKLPSSIMGLHSKAIENLHITNYTVRYGYTQDAVSYNGVPFEEFAYPMALMYEKLPAYALYCRNVEGLHLERVAMYPAEGDMRPAMTFDRVDGLELTSIKGGGKSTRTPMVHFRNTTNAFVSGCRSLYPGAALFEVERESCKDLKFANNLLHPQQKEVSEVAAIPDKQIFEDFPTETKYSVMKGTVVDGLRAHDLGTGPLRVSLEMLKAGSPQLCLLILNGSTVPEKVLVTYKGITQEFSVSWNRWGWAPVTLTGDLADGQRVDFEIRGASADSRLKIAKAYVRYQDVVKTD